MHLYKILSVYSAVLKPLKYGNFTVNISDAPRITLADLHTIFHEKTTEHFEKMSKLNLANLFVMVFGNHAMYSQVQNVIQKYLIQGIIVFITYAGTVPPLGFAVPWI